MRKLHVQVSKLVSGARTHATKCYTQREWEKERAVCEYKKGIHHPWQNKEPYFSSLFFFSIFFIFQDSAERRWFYFFFQENKNIKKKIVLDSRYGQFDVCQTDDEALIKRLLPKCELHGFSEEETKMLVKKFRDRAKEGFFFSIFFFFFLFFPCFISFLFLLFFSTILCWYIFFSLFVFFLLVSEKKNKWSMNYRFFNKKSETYTFRTILKVFLEQKKKKKTRKRNYIPVYIIMYVRKGSRADFSGKTKDGDR